MYKVSHSKVKCYRHCMRQFYYRYVMKIRRRVKPRPLTVGSLIHNCLESYFKTGYYLKEINKWKRNEYDKMFKEERVEFEDVAPLAKELMRGYISSWKLTGLEMVWVEKDFEVEIFPGINLVGKIDGLAKDKRRWLVEHKTANKMPGEEVRIFDTQVILYNAVLPELGERRVSGVIWDYIKTKLPAKPELLKSGGLSTRKNIDTTPEVYLREIKRHGFDPEGYKDILKELEVKRQNFYRQVKLPISKDMSDRVMAELIVTSNMMREHEAKANGDSRAYPRNLTRDCSWCDMGDLCHAELVGSDTDFILKHDYVEKEDGGKKVNSKKSKTSK